MWVGLVLEWQGLRWSEVLETQENILREFRPVSSRLEKKEDVVLLVRLLAYVQVCLLILIVCLVELTASFCFVLVKCLAQQGLYLYLQNTTLFVSKIEILALKLLLPFHFALACMVHRNVWIQMSDLAPWMYGCLYSWKQNSFCVKPFSLQLWGILEFGEKTSNPQN